MSVINATGWEYGVAYESYSTSGTIDLAYSTDKKTGDYCLRVNPTGVSVGWVQLQPVSSTGILLTTNSGPAQNYIQFQFKAAALPASNEEEFFVFKDCCALRVASDGTVKLFNSNYTTQPTSGGTSSAGVITQGTWHHLELYVQAGSVNAWLKVDGVTVLTTSSGSFGGSASDFLYFGKYTDRYSQDIDFLYDDAVWSDSSLGAVASIKRLSPANTAASKYTGYTTTNGFGDYRDVDEIPWNPSGDYVQAGSIGAHQTFALESCATGGISGTIHGVIAGILRYGASTQRLVFVDSGNGDNYTASHGAGTASSMYRRVFDVNPYDSQAWETADIDSVQVGQTDDNSYTQRLHACGLIVIFTSSATQPITPQQRDYAPDAWQLFHNPR